MNQDVRLTAYRHAVWGGADGSEEVVFLGEDLAGAQMTWTFARQYGGSPQIRLENAETGREGLSVRYEPDYTHPGSGQQTGATIIVPQIEPSTFSTILAAEPTGAPLELHHTFYVTRTDGTRQAEFAGTMTIHQGVAN